jgi:rhodanese-related sulfurtransferase
MKIRKTICTFLSIALLSTFLSCTAQENPSLQQIHAAELPSLLSDSSIVILDVRTDNEFNEGHVKNALHADVLQDNFEDKAATLLPDKNKPVYVYCRSGSRSLNASDKLISMGYTQVINVQEGISGMPESILVKPE